MLHPHHHHYYTTPYYRCTLPTPWVCHTPRQVTIFVHDAEREVEGLLIKAYLTADDTRHLGQLTGPFGKLVGVLVTPAMTKDALLGDKDSRNTGDKKDGSGTSDMKESSSTSDKGV